MKIRVIDANLRRETWRLQPGRYVVEISRHLAAAGHDVQILSGGAHALPVEDTIDGFTVRRLRSVRYPLLMGNSALDEALSGADLVLWNTGVVGLLQKLSTNHLSADSALTWLIVGFLFFLPAFYPGRLILDYSGHSWILAFLSGVINMLGAWTLLAAMRSGGKASIVVPFTALYPFVVVLAAPLLFDEPILFHQSVGIICALAATVRLSMEKVEAAA